MPDGSEEWTVRGELNAPQDSMVVSLDVYQDVGCYGYDACGAVKSLECTGTDLEIRRNTREFPYASYKWKKNFDVHGGQYGLKSCPTKPVFNRSRERTPVNFKTFTDNRLTEEKKEDAKSWKKFIVKDEKDSLLRKNKKKLGDLDLTLSVVQGNHWKQDMSYPTDCNNVSMVIEKSEKNISNNDKYNSSNVDRVSKQFLKSIDRAKENSHMPQNRIEKGSLSSLDGLKKGSSKSQGRVRKGSLKNEKEQIKKLVKCTKKESESENKVKELENEKIKLTEKSKPNRILSNKEALIVSLKEIDKNKLEENRKLSHNVDEEEETVVKTMVDPMSETDGDEKQDSNVKEKSLGFSVHDPQYEECSFTSGEKSYMIKERTVQEDSWYNSVGEDISVTKDTSIEYTTYDCDCMQKDNCYDSVMYQHPCQKYPDDFIYSNTLSNINSQEIENVEKMFLCMLDQGNRNQPVEGWNLMKSSDKDKVNWSYLHKSQVETLINNLQKLVERFLERMRTSYHRIIDESSLGNKEVANGNHEKIFATSKFVHAKSGEVTSVVYDADKAIDGDKSINANTCFDDSSEDDDDDDDDVHDYDENKDNVNQNCSFKKHFDAQIDVNDVDLHDNEDDFDDENGVENECNTNGNDDSDGYDNGNNDENDDDGGDDDNNIDEDDDDEIDLIDADEKDDDDGEKIKNVDEKVALFDGVELTDCNMIKENADLPQSADNVVDKGQNIDTDDMRCEQDDSVDRECYTADIPECIEQCGDFIDCDMKMEEGTKVSGLGFSSLLQLEMQMMELQIKGDELDIKMRNDEMKLDQIGRKFMMFSQPDNWNQVFYQTVLYKRSETGFPVIDFLSKRIKYPTMPISDQFIPKKEGSGRYISLFREYRYTGRQCSDCGGSHGDRRNSKDAGGDKNKKNRRNEEDKNAEQNKKNNNDKNHGNNNNNNNNNNSLYEGVGGIDNDVSALTLEPSRTIEDSHLPENDYKGYRKKKHKIKDNCDWLEKLNNELTERGGPSLQLFSILTDHEDVCVENCLDLQGDMAGETLACFVCMTVDSLLKHFTNCQSIYNGCDMCVKFFSLLCSHVASCLSQTRNLDSACDIGICRTVINMIPSANIESHLKTLWFQVRKKLARSIDLTDVEDVIEAAEKPIEKIEGSKSKQTLCRKPSGSGPLPSIPEGSVLPSTPNTSKVLKRKRSQMRPVGENASVGISIDEGANSAQEEMIEAVDHGAAGNDENATIERSEIATSRPETDAMPTTEDTGRSEDNGSNDFSSSDSSGLHGVTKRFVSLPPAGPPCAGDNYFPSFQDRPTGVRGIGEVDYANRNQMLVVVSVWEKFKTQFMREAKLAKHYREEGIILSKFRSKLKIHKCRYNLEFQWVKLAHLGNGMTGKCHLAMDFETEFKFCVKEVHISNYEKDEIELMSALDHEYVVQVYGSIRHGEKIYILQEFIEGGCLTEAINIQKKLGRRLSQQTALRHFQQLLKVLVYMKKCNILHEDIKADNILLDRSINDMSGPSSIKLTDFGMARRCQGSVPSGTKPVGTQTQWSPEKAEAVGYGYPAEVWAAICVLVHVLSGLPPWVKRYEEMKALILVIVDKSPPLEDIPKNILEGIKDLIRRGFTVCQSQRPTAEELLNHSAFQMLDGGYQASGIYSILESVQYQSNNLLPATNSIEDSNSARKDHSIVDMLNLGINIPPAELTVCPVSHESCNEGAASANGGDAGTNVFRGDNAAGINPTANERANADRTNSSEYDLHLLAQHEDISKGTTTPSSAQPSHGSEPYMLYLYDEFSVKPNLPNLSMYEPNQFTDNQEKAVNVPQPETVSIDFDDAIKGLLPDFGQLFSSNETDKTLQHEDNDDIENFDKALNEVISQHVNIPSENTSCSSLNVNIDDEEKVGPNADLEFKGQVKKVGHVDNSGTESNLCRSNISHQDEIVDSIRSFDEDDLFDYGPSENTKSDVRKVRSETDMENNDKLPTGNQPQSAPPYLHQNPGAMLLGNQAPGWYTPAGLSPRQHPGTRQNNNASSLSQHGYSGQCNSRPQYYGQTGHYHPRTSTPLSRQQAGTQNGQPGEYPNIRYHGNPNIHQTQPRELFPGNNHFVRHGNPNIPQLSPLQPRDVFIRNEAINRLGNPTIQPTNNPVRVKLGAYNNNSPDYRYWQTRIGQLQPRTPILNPPINPRATLFPTGNKKEPLQLDIKIAQEGTDVPISSQIQTAPVFSPPKTPKKSPDLLRAQSVVPKITSKPPGSYTGLSSSPNDAMSTSTTRSQFEEQEAILKEFGNTAMDALSQHSDHHVHLFDENNELYHNDDDRVIGELDMDEEEVLADPAKSFAYLLDPEDNSITIKFVSEKNDGSMSMKFESKYFNDTWRHIIETVLENFVRHNMKGEFGLTKFNLKSEQREIIDLDECLGSKSRVLIMSAVCEEDTWWIERGMIYYN